MYIDNDNFVAWMERIMDRLDMQDKKIDRLMKAYCPIFFWTENITIGQATYTGLFVSARIRQCFCHHSISRVLPCCDNTAGFFIVCHDFSMIFTTFARVVQENSGDWTGINRELLFPDSYTTSFKARMHLKYFNMSSSYIKHFISY